MKKTCKWRETIEGGDTLPSHKPGGRRGGRGGGIVMEGWRGLSRERETRVCTPTCHTHEVPQEVEGRGTMGKRK